MFTVFNQKLRVIAIILNWILFLVFSFMFYHMFLKHNRKLRIKLLEFFILNSLINVMRYFKHSDVYDGIKICNQLHFCL